MTLHSKAAVRNLCLYDIAHLVMFTVHFIVSVSIGQFVKLECLVIHIFDAIWEFWAMCEKYILWEIQKDGC